MTIFLIIAGVIGILISLFSLFLGAQHICMTGSVRPDTVWQLATIPILSTILLFVFWHWIFAIGIILPVIQSIILKINSKKNESELPPIIMLTPIIFGFLGKIIIIFGIAILLTLKIIADNTIGLSIWPLWLLVFIIIAWGLTIIANVIVGYSFGILASRRCTFRGFFHSTFSYQKLLRKSIIPETLKYLITSIFRNENKNVFREYQKRAKYEEHQRKRKVWKQLPEEITEYYFCYVAQPGAPKEGVRRKSFIVMYKDFMGFTEVGMKPVNIFCETLVSILNPNEKKMILEEWALKGTEKAALTASKFFSNMLAGCYQPCEVAPIIMGTWINHYNFTRNVAALFLETICYIGEHIRNLFSKGNSWKKRARDCEALLLYFLPTISLFWINCTRKNRIRKILKRLEKNKNQLNILFKKIDKVKLLYNECADIMQQASKGSNQSRMPHKVAQNLVNIANEMSVGRITFDIEKIYKNANEQNEFGQIDEGELKRLSSGIFRLSKTISSWHEFLKKHIV